MSPADPATLRKMMTALRDDAVERGMNELALAYNGEIARLAMDEYRSGVEQLRALTMRHRSSSGK